MYLPPTHQLNSQVNQDRFNGAVCVGSCGVYRRSSVEPFGGVVAISHSEDMYTGYKMTEQGHKVRCTTPVHQSTGPPVHRSAPAVAAGDKEERPSPYLLQVALVFAACSLQLACFPEALPCLHTCVVSVGCGDARRVLCYSVCGRTSHATVISATWGGYLDVPRPVLILVDSPPSEDRRHRFSRSRGAMQPSFVVPGAVAWRYCVGGRVRQHVAGSG